MYLEIHKADMCASRSLNVEPGGSDDVTIALHALRIAPMRLAALQPAYVVTTDLRDGGFTTFRLTTRTTRHVSSMATGSSETGRPSDQRGRSSISASSNVVATTCYRSQDVREEEEVHAARRACIRYCKIDGKARWPNAE